MTHAEKFRDWLATVAEKECGKEHVETVRAFLTRPGIPVPHSACIKEDGLLFLSWDAPTSDAPRSGLHVDVEFTIDGYEWFWSVPKSFPDSHSHGGSADAVVVTDPVPEELLEKLRVVRG